MFWVGLRHFSNHPFLIFGMSFDTDALIFDYFEIDNNIIAKTCSSLYQTFSKGKKNTLSFLRFNR
jgi:hypothetical protein